MVNKQTARISRVANDYLFRETQSMSEQKQSTKILVVVFAIGAILCLHYFTLPNLSYQHALYRTLFYLPLALGSLWFGLKGAIWVASSVSLLYLPYAISHWHGFFLEEFHQVLEGVLYIVIALILGLLVEKDRRQHRALLRAESLAAVGRAISEVAHDMKTPLLAVAGFANQISTRLPKEDPNRKKLDIIVQEASRLGSMVKHMLEFASPLQLHATKGNLNQLVQETAALAQPVAGEAEVELKIDLEPSLPDTLVDVDRVKQALLNLITNAIQASTAGKEVLIETHCLRGGVALEVVDHGCGIKEQDRKDLFSPFFSRKKGRYRSRAGYCQKNDGSPWGRGSLPCKP